MMIEYKTGNIFESKCQVLVCPVNCNGVMGKGLARAFKEKDYGFYKEYKTACEDGSLHIGELLYTLFDNKQAVCFPTKNHWKYPSRIEYIEDGLIRFLQYQLRWCVESIAFPKLGCGLGGLYWDQVKPLMEKYLGYAINAEIEIYV